MKIIEVETELDNTIPPFLAYFSRPGGSVIVSANKCASRFLDDILEEKKQYHKIHVQDDTKNDFLDNSSLKKKFFVYRDPIDRFIGWYNGFVYTPYKPVTAKYQSYTSLLEAAHNNVSFIKRDLIQNIHHFLNLYSREELKNLLKWDTHTFPLYTYFKYTNFSPDDYNILSLYDVSEYVYDKTGDKYTNYPTKNLIITRNNLKLLQEIEDIFSDLYTEDYDILGSRMKRYNDI
jgi:hypothetical protein